MLSHFWRTRALCALLLPTPLLAWHPVDLYPSDLLGAAPTHNSPQSGRALLAQVLQKAYGYQQTDAADSSAWLHIELRDDWRGDHAEHIPPWLPQGQRLQLRFSPSSLRSQIEFVNGPLANSIWGVEGKREGSWGFDIWQSFTRDAGGVRTPAEDQEKAFVVNAYRTMFELPKILAAAPLTAIVSSTSAGAQVANTECVFATWHSAKPQMENEQYLAWIDARTLRIKKVRYTLRALAPDASAELNFIAFAEDARGVFPTQIECVLQVHNRRYTHQINVEHYRWETTK